MSFAENAVAAGDDAAAAAAAAAVLQLVSWGNDSKLPGNDLMQFAV